MKAEAEERELELLGKVKELEEEYERFLEELVRMVGYGEKGEKRVEVVERVAALIQAEINLKKQVSDLEKKETAYSKTIQEADTIMARVELSYQERIKELEQEKHDLKERLWEMEERYLCPNNFGLRMTLSRKRMTKQFSGIIVADEEDAKGAVSG